VTDSAAIVGLGFSDVGRQYGKSASEHARAAVIDAVTDAGLSLSDLDGLLVNPGLRYDIGPALQRSLGLRDLRFLLQLQAYGSTALTMVAMASKAVLAGEATAVACVFADTPLVPGERSGAVYDNPESRIKPGLAGLAIAEGIVGANVHYALAARRHMTHFGTTSEQFGAVAVSARKWSQLNPLAQLRKPITIEEHQASRWIVEPLHLLDCCIVSNGGIAVVVTRADKARALRHPPVYVLGWGQGHPGYTDLGDSEFGLVTGARAAGAVAMRMAGVTPADINIRELYDCYTYTVVVTLEDYGFCGKGEGGPLAASGVLEPGGALPTNTGGGQLAAYYMWGMTPLSEAVIQVRGQGGDRQVWPNDTALVSGNGGMLDHHSTLILGAHDRI
jgi:acetyl-CoA acetyltransferase